MPPALVLLGGSPLSRQGSTHGGRFSDEPFRLRDIQFDCPRILVEACASREEIGDFRGTCRFGGSHGLPSIASVEVQDSLQASHVTAPAGDQKEDRTPFGIALLENGSEVSGGRSTPDDACDFDVRRKAAAQQDSGGVPLVRAHQNSGERIAAACAAHLLERCGIACHPADRGERLQMLRSCVDW